MSNSLRTLVVDDSALYRKFVSSVLEEIQGVEVIGTAHNGRAGLEKIQELQPDLVTLDLEMPELDGIGLLRELSAHHIEVATIMISSLTADGAKATNTALQLGAFDFVLKPIGKGADESRRLLRKDLAPKIEAFVTSPRRSKHRASSPKPISTRPARDVVSQMRRRVNAILQPPQIVCIGVSTGGPVALTRLLPKLPADFPCPILIVQHMPPMFTKSLADDLNQKCPLHVLEAYNGLIVRTGQILIAPGGSQMRIAKADGKTMIQITDDPPERNCKPAVDYLFRSVAENFGDRAVGVILTGMGDDGTIGCQLLKQHGCHIIAQDEASCVVYGMPCSVTKAGFVDQIAPLDEIAEHLVQVTKQGKNAAKQGAIT